MKHGITLTLTLAALMGAGTQMTSVAAASAADSVIPPIVLQGCAEKIKAHHGRLYANRNVVTAGETGAQTVGFDLSFVNTTQKVAKIVMIRVGGTDFTKIGKFSPDAVIAWRLAAPEGTCEVRAVRFEDGTEWSELPSQQPSTTPAVDTVATPIPERRRNRDSRNRR